MQDWVGDLMLVVVLVWEKFSEFSPGLLAGLADGRGVASESAPTV